MYFLFLILGTGLCKVIFIQVCNVLWMYCPLLPCPLLCSPKQFLFHFPVELITHIIYVCGGGQERVWGPWSCSCRHLRAALCGAGTGSSGQSRKPFNCCSGLVCLSLESELVGWRPAFSTTLLAFRVISCFTGHVVVFSHLKFQRSTKPPTAPNSSFIVLSFSG